MFQHFQLLVFQKSVTAGVHVYVVMLISPLSPHRRVKIPAPLGGKLAFNTLTECFKWSEPNTFSFVGCRIRNIEPWREITGPKKGHYMHSPKFYGNIRERYFYFLFYQILCLKPSVKDPTPTTHSFQNLIKCCYGNIWVYHCNLTVIWRVQGSSVMNNGIRKKKVLWHHFRIWNVN